MTIPPDSVQPPQAQPPQYAPPQYAAPQLPPKPSRPSGLAVTALVIGIVAFVVGLIPVVGIILGLIGVIFGIAALVKKQSKGLAVTGLVLAALALLASIATTAGLGAAVDSVAKSSTTTTTAEQEEAKPAESAEPAPTAEPEPAPEPAPKERLTLDEGWTVGTDEFGFSTRVNGYVSNNSDKAVTNYVQITFDTYDAAGANLGTCLANANTIDANGKWKFEAICFDSSEEIADVRFKEITGF